jgi:hypothetical protein
MKTKVLITATVTCLMFYVLSSCYRNKEDILALPTVSFRGDVVPIITSGGCGCHNNGQGQRAVQFSHYDTVFYDAILARVSLLGSWVNGGTHPGGGAVEFNANDKLTIQKWVSQGGKDDGGGCTITGAVTYTTNIFPVYNVTCKGSTCHAGLAVPLDFNRMVTKKDVINTMMNSGGAVGHPGGTISLSTCTVNLFKAWLAQGQPQ